MPSSPPIGDRYNFRHVFVDDFATDVPLGSFPAAVKAKWSAYGDGTPDSTGHGHYYPTKTVSIENGVMTVHVHTEDGIHMVAALMPAFASTYGRYAFRFRADLLPGYKFVSLLWPNREPPRPNIIGEIDFLEKNLDTMTGSGFLHPKGGGAQKYVVFQTDDNEWHDYVIEWSPNLLVFIRDGIELWRESEGIPSEGFHWVLQTETKMGGAPPPQDTVAGAVQFEWVSGWKYDTAARPPSPTRMLILSAPAVATNTVPLAVDASDDINAVKFMVDTDEIGYDSVRPFTRSWDSTKFANGVHNIWVKGHTVTWFNGAKQTIRIRNPWDIVMPEVFTGRVQLGLDHAYPWIRQVQWAVDGKNIGNRNAAPWAMTWDTTKVPNGPHTIYVKTLGTLNGSGVISWVNGPAHTIMVSN